MANEVPAWAKTVGSIAVMITILIVVGVIVARSPSESSGTSDLSDSSAQTVASDAGDAGIPSTTAAISGVATPPTSITFRHIWPFETSTTRFVTPEDAALSFATDYLSMNGARAGQIVPADPGLSLAGADVEIFPTAVNTPRMVVHVEQDTVEDWVVLGASADQIVVDQPQQHAAVTAPIDVTGQSTTLDGQLGVSLRRLGSKASVTSDTTVGGTNGVMAPFQIFVQPPALDEPLVLLVSENDPTGVQPFAVASVVLLGA